MYIYISWASQVALVVKNPPINTGEETRVQSLGQGDNLEGMKPTPAFLPRESHGQRSLVGYIVHGVTNSQTQLK